MAVFSGPLHGFAVEKLDQSRPMMLLNHVDDRSAELVLFGLFHSVLHVGLKYQRTHTRFKLIVRIRPATLIFNEV